MPVDEEKAEKQAARSFQDVNIWQKAHQWVLGIYKLTDGFPKNEQFGLTSKLRRANAATWYRPRRWDQWSDLEKDQFEYWCVGQMDKHYPGWKETSLQQRT